jgi:glyoxylase-like metal-dependent hydrolase (beta-lactamase superfamily II)
VLPKGTTGHISVLDPVGSPLVVGDAMGHMHHRLSGSNPQDTADMVQAKQSLKKLAALTFAQAGFGHGDPLAPDASAAVVPLARTL